MTLQSPASRRTPISRRASATADTARAAEPDEDLLGDAVAFEGVAKYPARIKCALLGWMAWKDATARALSAGGESAVAHGDAAQAETSREQT